MSEMYLGEIDNDWKDMCYTILWFQQFSKSGTAFDGQ
jgi:hypothetical protein